MKFQYVGFSKYDKHRSIPYNWLSAHVQPHGPLDGQLDVTTELYLRVKPRKRMSYNFVTHLVRSFGHQVAGDKPRQYEATYEYVTDGNKGANYPYANHNNYISQLVPEIHSMQYGRVEWVVAHQMSRIFDVVKVNKIFTYPYIAYVFGTINLEITR